MEEFAKKLQSDDAFAKDFAEYLKGSDAKIKEGSKSVAKELDKLMMQTILDFAKSKNMEIKDSEKIQDLVKKNCKDICGQLDKLIMTEMSKVFKK